jgi:hypothetical protein
MESSYNAQFTSKHDLHMNINEGVQNATLDYIDKKINFEDEFE